MVVCIYLFVCTGVKGIDGAVAVNLDLLSTIEEEPEEFNCMAVFCGFGL